MNPYAQYLPPLLLVFGGLLQWIRQFGKVHDLWVYLIAFVLANLGYWACFDYSHHAAWQMELIQYGLAISGYTGTVIGGTFTLARMAAAGVSAVPVTNSK